MTTPKIARPMTQFLVLATTLLLPAASYAQERKKPAQEVWNELFAKREGKEHQFNKFLAERVRGLPPGKALDIGMGQGRNSMFLAALGWEVTGFDYGDGNGPVRFANPDPVPNGVENYAFSSELIECQA